MTENSKKTVTALLSTVIVAITGLTGTLTATLYKDRQLLEDRVYLLEREAKTEKGLRHKADLISLSLKYELEKSFKMIDVIQVYIDALPFPAWIKRKRGNGEFEMIVINKEFVKQFDINKKQYEGKTDLEILPPDIANLHKQIDLQAYTTLRHKCGDTIVIKNGVRTKATYCSFPLRLEDKTYGVGGIIPK